MARTHIEVMTPCPSHLLRNKRMKANYHPDNTTAIFVDGVLQDILGSKDVSLWSTNRLSPGEAKGVSRVHRIGRSPA